LEHYTGLALDLDDTLLGPDRKLGQLARVAVQEAVNLGVSVVIATGRDRSSATKVARRLNTSSPVIANSGAVVVDEKGCPLQILTLSGEIYSEIVNGAANSSLMYVYSDRGIYTNRPHPRTKRYAEILNVPIDVKPDLTEADTSVTGWDVYGVSIRTEPELASEICDLWARRLEKRAEIVHSVPGLVEILPAGSSKGEGLRVVSDHLDIPLSDWVAVGDSQGDISMVRTAGCGVLVANAPQGLHQAADWMTEKPYTDGVLEVISRFWGSPSSMQK